MRPWGRRCLLAKVTATLWVESNPELVQTHREKVNNHARSELERVLQNILTMSCLPSKTKWTHLKRIGTDNKRGKLLRTRILKPTKCKKYHFLLNDMLLIVSFLLLAPACDKDKRTRDKSETPKTFTSGDGAEYLPREIIVKRSPSSSQADFTAAVARHGGALVENTGRLSEELGYVRIILSEETLADEVISGLQADGVAESAERNYIITLDDTPNDPSAPKNWGLEKIAASKAWDLETGTQNVVVAITDSGIDLEHEDLSKNIWHNNGEIPGNNLDDDGNGFVDDIHGWDFANGDNTPMDDKGHGTHCAGIVGAVGNNDLGVAGVNWNVRLMALKFMQADGRGTLWDATQALLYAAQKGVDVVNASWGCRSCYTEYFNNAVVSLKEAGAMFVASAGNDATNVDNTPYYPAAFGHENVIAVAATTPTDALAGYSNYGVSKVHISAPGSAIHSTLPGNKYGDASGTSMAAPFVTGAAALFKAAHPDATFDVIKSRILLTADPIGALVGKVATGGRLNINRMLSDDAEAPPAPSVFTVAAGKQSDALLSWSPVDASDLAMYRVRWGTGSGLFAESRDIPKEETETVVENLPNDVRTYFVVHAVDQSGNVSLPSVERSIMPGDRTAPAQVIDLVASAPSKVRASGTVFAASSEASDYYRAENAYDGSEETAWIAMPNIGTNGMGVETDEVDDEKEQGKDTNCGYNKERGENCGKNEDKDKDKDSDDRDEEADRDTDDVRDTDESDNEEDSDDSDPDDGEDEAGTEDGHPNNLEYVIVDFDEPHTIDRIVLTPIESFPEFFPIDYDIAVTQDGSDWVLVGGGRNTAASASDHIEIRFPGVLASAVRLTVRKAYRHESGLYYAGIAEMAVYQMAEEPGQIKLRFTSPGDDPGFGKAERYDIRYALSEITESNFDEGTPIPSSRTSVAGVMEEVLVKGLRPETAYWFAMTAVDEAGNISPMSNVAMSGTAVMPPGTIIDLEALTVERNAVELTWTAPGGDGYEGQAAAYDLRYSTSPITAATFEQAVSVLPPPPSPARHAAQRHGRPRAPTPRAA